MKYNKPSVVTLGVAHVAIQALHTKGILNRPDSVQPMNPVFTSGGAYDLDE